jgi:signal transduction histidine kinase
MEILQGRGAIIQMEEEVRSWERSGTTEDEVLRLADEIGRLQRGLREEATARYRAEMLYRDAQRFESLVKFTTTAAFELSQAVTIARGYAEVIQEEMISTDGLQQLSTLRQSLDRAGVIIKQLLILHADSSRRREEDFGLSGES